MMKRIGRQRYLFVMVLTGFALLSLAVMIRQLRAAPLTPLIVNEQSVSPGPDTELTGWLTTIWGDGLPGTAALPPLYRLTLADGRILDLQPASDTLNLYEWAGKQVSVQGEFVNGRAAASDFVVTAVQPLLARGGDDDVLGSQPWVSILCKFADYPDEPKPLSYFEDIYSSDYPGLDHYWREASYEAMNLEESNAYGWYTLPYTRGHYMYDEYPGLGELFNDCTAVADPFVDFSQYVGINLMFSWDFGAFAYGGQSYTELDGEARIWLNTWIPPWGFENQTLMAHEMGHGFGLFHSLSPYGHEYGNQWDVMSDIWANCQLAQHPVYGCLGQHTIAFHKEILGWLPPDKQVNVSQGEHVSLTLERLALPATNNPLIAKILLGGPDTPTYFTVETRQAVGYDVRLGAEAVVIHLTSPYFPQAQAMISGTLGVGDSYHDIPGQITVTVLSETPTGYVVDIQYAAFSCANQADVSVGECEALIELYNQTNGDTWNNNANWFYGSPCTWYGVTCDVGHVLQLNFYSNNLTGNIPAALKNLPYLENVIMNGSRFEDSLPGWLFTDLPNLRYLDLSGSELTGTLPVIIGTAPNLQALVLYDNQLTGSIPTELGNLLNLVSLDLNDNQLNGPIPASLGNLVNLQFLHLANNQLSGTVPPELGNLTALLLLNLGGNELEGAFPTAVTQMTHLFNLHLHDNQFTGPIPAGIGNLTQLRELTAYDNQFSGNLPPEMALLTNLFAMNLSNNHLTGPLPSTAPPFLSVLRLANNEFTGTIPATLFDSLSYAEIDLSQNHLEGNIPSVITRSHFLWGLDVSGNLLSGELPTELGEFAWLNYLDVSHNQLEGEMPASLANLMSLQSLDVGYNKLTARTELLAFLAAHDPDWQMTQTVPPTAVRVTDYTSSTAQLIWATIPYTADGGFYEVSYALAPTGTYTVHGVTADKSTSSYLLDNLQPDTPYTFRVRTFTPAHDEQQSDLWSHYSNSAFIPVSEIFLVFIPKS